jgi:hypothetical protein
LAAVKDVYIVLQTLFSSHISHISEYNWVSSSIESSFFGSDAVCGTANNPGPGRITLTCECNSVALPPAKEALVAAAATSATSVLVCICLVGGKIGSLEAEDLAHEVTGGGGQNRLCLGTTTSERLKTVLCILTDNVNGADLTNDGTGDLLNRLDEINRLDETTLRPSSSI